MSNKSNYTPTEAKYKGTAQENYITYDLEQETRGTTSAMYPKVKRVYIAGDVQDWDVGTFEKQSRRTVYGVRIDYEQKREGYRRKAYNGERNGTTYEVPATAVEPSISRYTKVVEIPEVAQNVRFQGTKLPKKYRSAMQNVR